MDKDAQEITTINTPIGLLRWTCLPFGIKTVSAIFQRAIESIFVNIIPNMIIFQDDKCVGGKNAEELKYLELTTDASKTAISGILLPNGHPVLFLSRSLSDAETRYSNIDREVLAIVWSSHRARHFLIGKRFKLISDHRPLENGVPEVLVSDNVAEFHDTALCQWLKKIGYLPYKTPPYHPQSNGLAGRMVGTVKMGMKAYSTDKGILIAYLNRILLSYKTIPHAGKSRSPSEMMGRQLRSPLTMSFESGSPLWYRQKPESKPDPAAFISQ
ncbi:uncharacterized protein LOC105847529 [Hydra vulgaris]|uniref:uncharacterized protein LOC105847529 n=1 Tax=Hydra vulgaris TaxID=6087 RepID=UPI000640CC92|nr:uncharacterized protein LOC105847529 [Hydra vulgaris]